MELTSQPHRRSCDRWLKVLTTPSAAERAWEPKQLIVVPGQYFDPYTGSKGAQYVTPELEWFEKHLMGK